MSESNDENQFACVSQNGFSLPEGRSDVKVADLVTIRCSSGSREQPPTADGREPSDGKDASTRSGKGAQDISVRSSHDDTVTSLSLPMATASGHVESSSSSSMATGLADDETTTTTEKGREFDSSSNRSIIPWLCDLEADDDQRLLDSDADDDSEVEIDRCEANRYADHAPVPGKSTEISKNSTTTTKTTTTTRESKHVDRRHSDDSVFLPEKRHVPTAAKHRDNYYGSGSTGSQDRSSSSSDECLSVARICNQTTPGFLRISSRGSDEDEGGSSGGQALLSRALDQVRRRLTDDLSPVLPDYETTNAKDATESAKLRGTYVRNLLVLGIGFMLVFTSFCALRSLQSTVNHSGGLGLAALSSLNASFAVGCVFATCVVQRVRPKRAIVLSLAGHLVYTAANVRATFYTLLPATVVVGFTMATLFVAQGTYLTSIAVTYAAVSGRKHDHIVGIFNGFFLFMLQMAQVFGNLISSTIFTFFADRSPRKPDPDFDDGIDGTPSNATGYSDTGSGLFRDDDNGTLCGSGYCHAQLIEALDASLYEDTVVVLVVVLLVVSLTGMVIIGLFLDKLDVIFNQSKHGLAGQMCAIVRLHRDRRLTLCAPLMTFLGMQEAFVYGEFTKGYVACPLGVHMIGYVMICFAACASISSVTIGYLKKYLPRSLIMVAGASLHLVVMASLYLWQPSTDDVLLVFVTSGLLGITDALWQTELCSLCGVLFDRRHREASFSCLRMYQAIGLCLALGYAQFLCVDVKIAILAGFMAFALVAYFAMELGITKTERGGQLLDGGAREPASV